MDNFLPFLITALGLACFIESLPWLIAPKKMQSFLQELINTRPELLRYWGIALLVTAIFLVWIGKSIA